MNRPRGRLVAAAIALLATSRTAIAGSDTVYLPPPVCAARPVDWEAFIAALRVELGANGIRIEERPSVDGVTLSVNATPCDALAGAVEIAVTDARGKRSVRAVSLVDVPESTRPRTAALACAELIAFATAESPATEASPVAPGPPVAPVSPAPAATVAPIAPAPIAPAPIAPAPPPAPPPGAIVVPLPVLSARPERVHPLLGLGGEFRRYLGPGTSLYGVRALSEWALPWDHVVARVDVTGSLGSSESTLGTVSLKAVAAAAGAEWVTGGNDVALALGAVAEVGYAHAGGEAKPSVVGTTASAATAAAVAVVSVRVRVVERFWAALELAAGVELAGFRAHADQSVAGGVEGALLGARLIAAFAH